VLKSIKDQDYEFKDVGKSNKVIIRNKFKARLKI